MRALILELKHAETEQELTCLSEAALEQLVNRKYADKLRHQGYTDIHSYGMAFWKKRAVVKMV